MWSKHMPALAFMIFVVSVIVGMVAIAVIKVMGIVAIMVVGLIGLLIAQTAIMRVVFVAALGFAVYYGGAFWLTRAAADRWGEALHERGTLVAPEVRYSRDEKGWTWWYTMVGQNRHTCRAEAYAVECHPLSGCVHSDGPVDMGTMDPVHAHCEGRRPPPHPATATN